MATYQGKQVKIVRPAKEGDQGFVAGSAEQVIIKGDDGREVAVPKNQVQDQDQAQGGQQGQQGQGGQGQQGR
jgi:hypothetical protein